MDYKIELLRLLGKLQNHSLFHGKDMSFSYNDNRRTIEYEYSSKGMETIEKVEEQRAEGVMCGIILDFDEEHVLNQDFINYIVNNIDLIEEFRMSIILTNNISVDFYEVDDHTNMFNYIMSAGYNLDGDYDLDYNCHKIGLFNNLETILNEIENVTQILDKTISSLNKK